MQAEGRERDACDDDEPGAGRLMSGHRVAQLHGCGARRRALSAKLITILAEHHNLRKGWLRSHRHLHIITCNMHMYMHSTWSCSARVQCRCNHASSWRAARGAHAQMLFLVPAFSAALAGQPARRVAVAPWRYATREARAEFTLDGDVHSNVQ